MQHLIFNEHPDRDVSLSISRVSHPIEAEWLRHANDRGWGRHQEGGEVLTAHASILDGVGERDGIASDGRPAHVNANAKLTNAPEVASLCVEGNREQSE